MAAKIDVTIDGAGLTKPDETKVAFIGPGYHAVVGNLDIRPGQQDQLTLWTGAEQLRIGGHDVQEGERDL